jgi:hypothetical protein
LDFDKYFHGYFIFTFPKFRARRHLGKAGMGVIALTPRTDCERMIMQTRAEWNDPEWKAADRTASSE